MKYFKGDKILISRKEIHSAKYADLPSTLQSMGINIVAEGKHFYLKDHDSLKFFQKDGMWLYKWWSCGEVGDGIQYLMNHCEKEFSEAVRLLSGHVKSDKSVPHATINNWWNKSDQLIKRARFNLFEPNGEKELLYLRNERGLHDHTIRKYQLGWLPEWRQMPSKLVIPCFRVNGDLIRIKFRIDNPMSHHGRYRIMKGSNTSIPFTSNISSNKPVLIVESELDAILIAQESGEDIGVLALGSVGTHLNDNIISYLNEIIPNILICLDNDEAGKAKTVSLLKVLKNACNWSIPEIYGKDPGEAYNRMNIKAWVNDGVKKG